MIVYWDSKEKKIERTTSINIDKYCKRSNYCNK